MWAAQRKLLPQSNPGIAECRACLAESETDRWRRRLSIISYASINPAYVKNLGVYTNAGGIEVGKIGLHI